MAEDTDIGFYDHLTSKEVSFLNDLDREIIMDNNKEDTKPTNKNNSKSKKGSKRVKKGASDTTTIPHRNRSRSRSSIRKKGSACDSESSQDEKEEMDSKKKKLEEDSNYRAGSVFGNNNKTNSAGPSQVNGLIASQIYYNGSDKGPFIVHLKKKELTENGNKVTEATESRKKRVLMNIEVARLLKLFGVKKFNLLEKYSRNIWQITCDKFEEANSILENVIIKNNNWETYIPREKLFCNGTAEVLKRSSLNYSLGLIVMT